MMRIRTVKPQIILIACLVIIHYLSAPSTRERECVYCMCMCCMCVCCVSVYICLCVGQPARHTQAAVYTDMKLLPNDIIISPSLSHSHGLPAFPYSPLPLPLLYYICLFLSATLSICLSLAFN